VELVSFLVGLRTYQHPGKSRDGKLFFDVAPHVMVLIYDFRELVLLPFKDVEINFDATGLS